MVQIDLMAAGSEEPTPYQTRWFSSDGCVVSHSDHTAVYIGGTLIGQFEQGDEVQRNILLVHLSAESRIKKGKLAWAFGLTPQHACKIRRRVKRHGIASLFGRPGRGRKQVVTPELHRKIIKAFDAGRQVSEVHVALSRVVSPRSISRVRTAWLAQQQASSQGSDGPALRVCSEQVEAAGEEDAGDELVSAFPVRGGQHVQHVGGWLLLSMVHALGLHAVVLRGWEAAKGWRQRLRVALDAVVLALGLGQRCVEGVRRLRTASGGMLLRAERVPTASWTRRVLKHYLGEDSDGGHRGEGERGHQVQQRMLEGYLGRCRHESKAPAVFYVDNHMRPYTGKFVVRKGWRMQDKRARPGATDYYVHDEDGRAVFRYSAPAHDSLSRWLSPVTTTLREALGSQQRVLVAFDRAGAYPETLSTLRDAGFEFVTYERRPYPLLSKASFTEQLVTREGEVIGVHEQRRKNLGKGRGRVRRISLRMADGQQVNLLAVSEASVARLVGVMLGRWVQENGFKHGNERWGINQLDGRKTEDYPPETVIPNPARRRLDHALKLARNQEGRARSKLARLDEDDPRRERAEQDLEEALFEQDLLLALRPYAPVRAPLQDTELADKLVKHQGEYKTLIDTIRVACANVESELSLRLAPSLRKPREAKKVLANVFGAPGAVRVNGKSITVTLRPAGTQNELQAIEALLEQVNRLDLSLPDDPEARRLRFRLNL